MDYSYIRIFHIIIVVYDLKQFANISIYSLILYTILVMESRLYVCPRYGKGIKSTSSLTRHVNVCKIHICLPYYQSLNPNPVLYYNMTNFLNLLLHNNKESIIPEISNQGDSKKTRTANINNDKEDIKLADINKQWPATLNWMPWNRL